jgi:hypothetical protein
MADLKLPFVKLRPQPDGGYRPRFVCGPRERAAGWRDEDLRHGDGRWFTLDEARTFAERRHAEIVAQR